MNTASLGTPVPTSTKTPETLLQVNGLNENIGRLEKLFDILVEKLRPVVSPIPQKDGAISGNAPPPMSPLSNALAESSGRVGYLCNRADSMLEALSI